MFPTRTANHFRNDAAESQDPVNYLSVLTERDFVLSLATDFY